jgi:hypothetical protein
MSTKWTLSVVRVRAVSTYRFCWNLRLAAADAGLTFEPSIPGSALTSGVRTNFVRTNPAPRRATPEQCPGIALACFGAPRLPNKRWRDKSYLSSDDR